MKNQDVKIEVTHDEFIMLSLIISAYSSESTTCYTDRLTTPQKEVVKNLVSKGLVYDSYVGFGKDDDDCKFGNWFPSSSVIKALGLPGNF
jgi:hypothetical protein